MSGSSADGPAGIEPGDEGGGGRAVVHTVRIGASPATVFRLLTDPERFVTWMGLAADLDPVPGGALRLVVTPDSTAAGHYREVVPDRRLVFSFGWEGSDTIPPGSTTVTIELESDGDDTVLHLRHDGLPTADDTARHAEGWVHFMERLALVGAGHEPGPDPWMAAGPPEGSQV